MGNMRELNRKPKRMAFQVYDGMEADLDVIQRAVGMGSKSQAVRLAIRFLANEVRKGRSFCMNMSEVDDAQ
jgi:hypothetical protein